MYRCIQKSPHDKSGFTLLETIMAVSLAALLMSPVVGMLRTCRGLWVQIQDDTAHADSLHATLRHITRNLRTAESVTFVDSSTVRAAELQFIDSRGQVCGWKHDVQTGQVVFARDKSLGLLAENIDQLKFSAFDESGRPTQDSRLVKMIQCTAVTTVKRSSNATRTATCTVWIRPAL